MYFLRLFRLTGEIISLHANPCFMFGRTLPKNSVFPSFFLCGQPTSISVISAVSTDDYFIISTNFQISASISDIVFTFLYTGHVFNISLTNQRNLVVQFQE